MRLRAAIYIFAAVLPIAFSANAADDSLALAIERLRAQVAAQPRNPMALSMLGAALDTSRRSREADAFHRRAVSLAPRSVDVLNNFAAHLRMSGNEAEAGRVYRQVLSLDPSQVNANLQMAQIALKSGYAAEALRYLSHVPQDRPEVLLLRLQSLYKSGNEKDGDALAARVLDLARTDAKLAFAAGVALENAQQHAGAESFFEVALRAEPADFSTLYSLGLTATAAHHPERAREVLTSALGQQPRNVDVLYSLAVAEQASHQNGAAVQHLAQAAKLAPGRADVQKLLAIATSELRAWDDAAAAWDRYLRLVPGDETAQRERDYTAVVRGETAKGIAGLEKYVERHPGDVVGQYELGQAAKSPEHLNKAIEINPAYEPARTARGNLLYQEGKPEEALKDLEAAASLRPNDATNLDRLGQAYQALDRTKDALIAFRRAAKLAPSEARMQLHLARALAEAGNTEESREAMDRFRQASSEQRPGIPAGFVDYLAMTPAERRANFRARVEKMIHDHPGDAAAQLSFLKIQLEDGQWKRAAATAERLSSIHAGTAVLAEAGRALLAARQYAPAKQLLAQVKDVELELAVADYYATGADPTRIAAVQTALDQALRNAPERADLYLEGATFLLDNGKTAAALDVLNAGVRRFPEDRDILLQRALALERAKQFDAAGNQFRGIQDRWPEWYPVWVALGAFLQRQDRPEEARKALQTAKALGANLH